MLPLSDGLPARRFPVVNVLLIAANFAVWILYELSHLNAAVYHASFYPCAVDGAWRAPEPWGLSWITAMFLHGSWDHILGNMLFLAIFGKNVEDAYGPLRYLVFYFAGGFAAMMAQTGMTLWLGTAADARAANLGASGAWSVVIRADSSRAPQLAAREDQTEGLARGLLVGASVASLLGAGYALHLAGRENGASRVLLIGVAVLTVMLSWTVINTVYTMRYADQHFRSKQGGIAFGTGQDQQLPGYREFAYVAFTIGMTYQVSDTTLRDPRIRRTVLAHATLSYVFGVVIVAGTVNLISGLFR